MAKGRVVIIESDEWTATLLAKFLRDGGYQVDLAEEARAGFDKVRAVRPDCILCAVNLPDIDGFWVARRVRAEGPPVSVTPFLFVTDAEDAPSRLQGLNVGADFFLNKPFRAEEAVAQVSAVIEMARRFTATAGRDPSVPPASSPEPMAFQGSVAEVSVPTVLTVLELERRTGRLKVKAQNGSTAIIQVADGAFASLVLDGRSQKSSELLREVLKWKQGTFHFHNGPVEPVRVRKSMSELLLEAMRLDDELRKR